MYTKEDLENSSIYQLRLIAHKIGVKAPTTKKRDELIFHILAIQNGEEESYFPEKKMGRPVKDLSIKNNIGPIMCLDSDDTKGRVVFNDSQVDRVNTTGRVRGYLVETLENEFYVVNYENPVAVERIAWVPTKMINKRRIRSGNFLVCDVLNRDDNIPMVSNFVEVEGQPYKGYSYEQFEHKKVCFDKHPYFSYAGGTVFYGDRVLFSGDKFKIFNYVMKLITQNYNYCESVVVLGLNLTPELVGKYKNNTSVELFYSLFSDNFETQYFTYKLAVDHSKRLAELGKRVILVVFDLDHLYDNLDMTEREKIESIKSLYGLARSFEESGSFTVVGTSSKDFYEKNAYFKDFIDMLIIEQNDNALISQNLRLMRNNF